jgi:hypothetical protein
MDFVLRLIHPPGKSAIATKNSAVDLLLARIEGKPVSGPYLEWFDVDANGGRGADRWTHDLGKAMRFPSFEAAMECWRAQSTHTPLRDDGKPNRPLTAYNVSIEKVR